MGLKTNYIQGLNSDLPLNLETLTPDAYGSFDGTGVISLNKNLNISTVTDLGTGYYKVFLANTMPTADYTVLASGYGDQFNVDELSTDYFTIRTYTSSGSPIDRKYVSFIVYGGKL